MPQTRDPQKIDSPNIHTPKNSVWKLRSFKIFNKVITILNLDTQKIAPDFGDPPQKNSKSLKPGCTSNFLLAMAMQFQQIIALPSDAQIYL